MIRRKASLAARLLAAAALAVLGATASVGVARQRPAVQAPPPPPPPMPDVGMASSLVRDAAAFRGYMRETTAISPQFVDAAGVSGALRSGAAYEPGQLRRGAIAYAAATALSDEAFVADVRRAGATPDSRYAITARIFANPANAMAFADAPRAAGLAKAVLGQAGESLLHDGDRIKQAAYDIQHQSWSLTPVSNPDQRASDVKTLSAEPRGTRAEDTAATDRLIGGETLDGVAPAPAPYSPAVVHAVALAALAAIGQAGDDATDRLGWLTDDYFLEHCLSGAKLALYECLAVAKPYYEDVFCLGQHAMRDTGECVARSAYVPVPIEIATARLSIPPVSHHTRVATRTRHKRR